MKQLFLKFTILFSSLLLMQPAEAQLWEILNPLPEGSGRYRCHFVDAQNGWVFRTGSTQLLRTRDGGNTWTELYPMTGMRYICMTDTLVGYMIVEEEWLKLFKTNDGGVNWTLNPLDFYFSTSIYQAVKPLYFINQSVGFIANDDSYMKTVDGGISWTEMELPFGGTAKRIHNINFVNDTIGWIAASSEGLYGKVFYTNNQGENWQLLKDDMGIISGLDALNENTTLITHFIFGYTNYYGCANLTINNFVDYSYTDCITNFRKGLFLNDTTILFYGTNLWTMHINSNIANEITNFPSTINYVDAQRLSGVVFLCGTANIAKRIDTCYVSLPEATNFMKKIKIYPNPVSHKLTVYLSDTYSEAYLCILDLAGQLYYKNTIFTNVPFELDIQYLTSGVYFLRLEQGNALFYSKFIKH